MVYSLFIGLLLSFIWGYFLCVATTYATCKDGPQASLDPTFGAADMAGNMMPGGDAENQNENKDK
jgi:hypothetical protein